MQFALAPTSGGRAERHHGGPAEAPTTHSFPTGRLEALRMLSLGESAPLHAPAVDAQQPPFSSTQQLDTDGHEALEAAVPAGELLATWLTQTADGDDLHPRLLRCADGSIHFLPVARWAGAADEVDLDLLDRACGPVLDVGCGPGRLTAALHEQGVEVLGLELVAEIPVRARASGAPLLVGDLFGPLPRRRQWRSVLLADGNVGIGGDPVRVLRRVRQLLAPGGRVLVELVPGGASLGHRVRLESLGVRSAWFDWTLLGPAELPAAASRSGLAVRDTWERDGRAFAALASS